MTDPLAEPPGPRPGWYRFAWFLGRPPPLSTRQWRVLGLVAAVSFFETYDLYLFSLNLKQIQSDLGVGEEQLGLLGALVRGGALLAILIAPLADRFGRRRLLLLTVLAYTLLTGLTAFAPNIESFVACQMLARGFATAETLLAAVVIVEEFAPAHRGWGIGALAAIQAMGAGFASILFGFVDWLPYGWRALYLVGLVPLALLAYWRRGLPETARFEALESAAVAPLPAGGKLRALARDQGRVFWALMIGVFLFGLAGNAAGFFAPKYLQDEHGWTPGGLAVLTLLGGALAIVGNPLAGWLGDRFGRRPVGAAFTACFALVVIGFYGSAGLLIPALWIGYVFFVMGSDVTFAAFGAELFPTSRRSTATAARGVFGNLGAITGLAAVSLLFPLLGSNWNAVMLLASLGLAVPLLIWLRLPETARRRLEDIAPEPGADPPPGR